MDTYIRAGWLFRRPGESQHEAARRVSRTLRDAAGQHDADEDAAERPPADADDSDQEA